METAERVSRLAAYVAAELPSGMIIGLGSGSTAEAIVCAIGERLVSEPAFTLTGVATSTNTHRLAESVGISLRDLSDVEAIDLGIDGADEIDPDLNLVKGKGGALLYEKLVAEICGDYWVVSTDEKLVDRLGIRLPLPVEVVQYGWVHTQNRLAELGLSPVLRSVEQKTYTTDAGNFILDCTSRPSLDLVETASLIKGTTGVVEHGVFVNIAKRAILVDQSGAIRTVGRK